MLDFLGLVISNLFFAGFVNYQNSFPDPLSPEDEREYVKQMIEGDKAARNMLIERNLRLVAHIAKKYQSNTHEQDDLISYGTIGLIKAVNTYKQDKNVRLATYAARCIENEILMALRATKKQQNEVSINEPIGVDKEGNEVALIDLLESDTPDIIEQIALKTQTMRLRQVMKNVLKTRENAILWERYGLNGQDTKTQREISKKLKISRSYVSRLEDKALKKLRIGMAGE